MVDETISKPGSDVDVVALWREAEMPEARRGIMDQVAALGFTDAALSAHRQMRPLLLRINDPTERSLAAHDYVVITTHAAAKAAATDVTGKILLLAQARTVCAPEYFDTTLALFGSYLHVAAVSCEKREMARVRDLIKDIPRAANGPNVRAWCWRELFDVTGDICDAERCIEAGGTWTDLGFMDINDARVRTAERRRLATAATAAVG